MHFKEVKICLGALYTVINCWPIIDFNRPTFVHTLTELCVRVSTAPVHEIFTITYLLYKYIFNHWVFSIYWKYNFVNLDRMQVLEINWKKERQEDSHSLFQEHIRYYQKKLSKQDRTKWGDAPLRAYCLHPPQKSTQVTTQCFHRHTQLKLWHMHMLTLLQHWNMDTVQLLQHSQQL